VLAWQIGFPMFAWRKSVAARTILLVGAAIAWAGALFLLKLPLFGPFTCICSLSYLRPEEWAWLKARAASMLRSSAEAKEARAMAKAGARK
jgi:ABC-type cobalamin transport system permease subunit